MTFLWLLPNVLAPMSQPFWYIYCYTRQCRKRIHTMVLQDRVIFMFLSGDKAAAAAAALKATPSEQHVGPLKQRSHPYLHSLLVALDVNRVY